MSCICGFSGRCRSENDWAALVEVDLRAGGVCAQPPTGAVTAVLANGRRLEMIGWDDLTHVPARSRPLRDLLVWLEQA